jgi:hypothetical protein
MVSPSIAFSKYDPRRCGLILEFSRKSGLLKTGGNEGTLVSRTAYFAGDSMR